MKIKNKYKKAKRTLVYIRDNLMKYADIFSFLGVSCMYVVLLFLKRRSQNRDGGGGGGKKSIISNTDVVKANNFFNRMVSSCSVLVHVEVCQ